MKIVVDTNVLVSAHLKRRSLPASVVRLVSTGKVDLSIDDRILTEYRQVLCRPRFRRVRRRAMATIRALEQVATRVKARSTTLTVKDPKDLPFLEVALTGRADALVTGNRKHFPDPAGSVLVLTPREFLDLFETM